MNCQRLKEYEKYKKLTFANLTKERGTGYASGIFH